MSPQKLLPKPVVLLFDKKITLLLLKLIKRISKLPEFVVRQTQLRKYLELMQRYHKCENETEITEKSALVQANRKLQ